MTPVSIRIKACERAIREQEQNIANAEKEVRDFDRKNGPSKVGIFFFIVLPIIIGLFCLVVGGKDEFTRGLGWLLLLAPVVYFGGTHLLLMLDRQNRKMLSDGKKNKKWNEEKVQTKLQDEKDVMAVLHEMLRLARDEGKLLEEQMTDDRILLSPSLYASLLEQNQTCKTCLYCGETINQTRCVDTGTIVSEKHVRYYCINRDNKEVQGENCCNNYRAARPVKAIDKALKMREPYEEEIRCGFR